jgi:hypothetical protein
MKTMADSQTAPESQDFTPNVRQAFGGMLPSILMNAVVPLVIYLLASPHMPTLPALALSAVVPLLYGGYGWVRARSIDPLSIIALALLGVGMLLALLVQDPRLLLLRDSYETGVFGLLCLLSLPFSKPVAYYMYRWTFVRTPEQLARLNAGWQVPYARFVRRLTTAVWGVVFLGEALLDTFLVYHLPIVQWMAIHPFLFWGAMVVAFGWATLYVKYATPKINAILRQMAKEHEALTGEDRPEASKFPVGRTGSV